MKSISLLVFLFALLAVPAYAANNKAGSSGNKDFERMKTLVGTWQGMNKMGEQEEMVTVVYALTSGGSAIAETLMPGTPREMITMYHAEGKGMAMTHYCAMGNHPNLTLKKSDGKILSFEMNGSRGLSSPQEAHMHSLKMTFVDKNTLKQEWTNFQDEKQKGSTTFVLKRKQ